MPPRPRTLEQFLAKANEVHDSKFIYPELTPTSPVGDRVIITITCPKHGDFTQDVQNHLRGRGCRKCADEARSINQKGKTIHSAEKMREIAQKPRTKSRRTIQDFMDGVNVHHQGKGYTYPDLSDIRDRARIDIICPEHGLFNQDVSNHLRGRGCPKCAIHKTGELKKIPVSIEQFLTKSKEVHDSKYTYDTDSITSMRFMSDTIKVICPEHGEFEQVVQNHLDGRGCSNCANANNALVLKKSVEEHITDFKRVHDLNPMKYDYSLFTDAPDGIYTRIKIICPAHGVFEQVINDHKKGTCCPKCAMGMLPNTDKSYTIGKAYPTIGHGNKLTKEYFLDRAKAIHGDRYEYPELNDPIKSKDIIKIVCKFHGSFEQGIDVHLYQKSGCPKCRGSHGERAIGVFLDRMGVEYQFQGKIGCINPKTGRELPYDFVIPSMKTIIEFDGDHHHVEVGFRGSMPKRLIEQQERDMVKEHHAKALGWRFIRVTKKTIGHFAQNEFQAIFEQ